MTQYQNAEHAIMRDPLKIMEAVLRLEHAYILLGSGLDIFDSTLTQLLVDANERLRDAGLDAQPGDIRHTLMAAVSTLKSRDPHPCNLVNPDVIQRLRQTCDLTCQILDLALSQKTVATDVLMPGRSASTRLSTLG